MITPMVARLVRDPFDRPSWLFELKWDGFRAIAETDGKGKVDLYSRNHNSFNERFPVVVQEIAKLKHEVIFDGEVVALDERGFPRFDWLVDRGQEHGTLVYYVFDLLNLDGKDWRQRPLMERKQRLRGLLDSLRSPRLLYVDHFEGTGRGMFGWVLGMKMEGLVAKDANSPYVEGPRETWHWQKVMNKHYKRQGKVSLGVKSTRDSKLR